MKNKRIILPLILLTLFTLTITGVHAADSAIIEVNTDNIYLTAGEENTVKIRLENTGDYKVYDIEAFLTSTTEGISVLTEAHKVYNEIGKEKSKSYEPVIYVDEDIELGSYSLSLTVIYRRFRAEHGTTITIPVALIVNGGYIPKLGFTTDQSKLVIKTGVEKQIDLGFTNRWTQPIEDLELIVRSEATSISIVDGLSGNYESLKTSESIMFSPTLSVMKGTTLDVYSLTVMATYTDEEGKSYHQTFTIPIRVNEAMSNPTSTITIKEAKVQQDSVQPGDIFELEVTFECNGADAYDLISALSLSQLSSISPVSPTTTSLGDLAEEETKSITYRMLVAGDADAGQYPVTLTLSYTDSTGVTRSLGETFTIMVEGIIEYRLLDTESIIVYPGTTDEFEADILLIGTESVEFVSISLEENAVFKRVQGSEEYIGAIDPDSPIPFDLHYKVDENTEPGTHQMTLLIKYRDHLNKPHETLLNVDVEISAGTVPENGEESNGGFWNWLRNLFR